MTGRPRAVDAVLRIVCFPRAAAYYVCLLCGHTESARGRDNTRDLAATVRRDHRAACPVVRDRKTSTSRNNRKGTG